MTIRNVLLALALTTFTLAGCTQNTTFGISANVLAFVDEEEETGNLPVSDATVDVLGADGIALSNFGISENQAADIETFTLDVDVDLTAAQGNDADATISAFIYLAESGTTLTDGQITTDSVTLAAGATGTLTLAADIDSTDASNLEILQSGNAVIGIRLAIASGGAATNSVDYTLQTVDLGGSYTPSDALTF